MIFSLKLQARLKTVKKEKKLFQNSKWWTCTHVHFFWPLRTRTTSFTPWFAGGTGSICDLKREIIRLNPTRSKNTLYDVSARYTSPGFASALSVCALCHERLHNRARKTIMTSVWHNVLFFHENSFFFANYVALSKLITFACEIFQ